MGDDVFDMLNRWPSRLWQRISLNHTSKHNHLDSTGQAGRDARRHKQKAIDKRRRLRKEARERC